MSALSGRNVRRGLGLFEFNWLIRLFGGRRKGRAGPRSPKNQFGVALNSYHMVRYHGTGELRIASHARLVGSGAPLDAKLSEDGSRVVFVWAAEVTCSVSCMKPRSMKKTPTKYTLRLLNCPRMTRDIPIYSETAIFDMRAIRVVAASHETRRSAPSTLMKASRGASRTERGMWRA